MLTRSFVHLPGIGTVTEQRLWDRGITEWNHLTEALPGLYAAPRRDVLRARLELSAKALEARDYRFFYQYLPRPDLWRLVPACFPDIAYLDIETTGQFGPPLCKSTAIAIYFRGKLYQEYEREKKIELLHYIAKEAAAVATFFGEVFDFPFLRAEYKLPLDMAHLDLCFWLKRLGFRGGLKRVEKCFPEIPKRQSDGVDGFDAVRLWKWHEAGMPGALETLLTYNAEDTVVLEILLVLAFNLEVKQRPGWGLIELPSPLPFQLPTKVDPVVYAKLTGSEEIRSSQSTQAALLHF